MWFLLMVDLFATRFNHHLSLYISLVPGPETWAMDTLSVAWANLLGYAFLPSPHVGAGHQEGMGGWNDSAVDGSQLTISAMVSRPLSADPHFIPSAPTSAESAGQVKHENLGQLQLDACLLCSGYCTH